MNIIKNLTDRIEEYRKVTKNPCKNYATEEAAEKATMKAAELAGKHIDSTGTPCNYLVFYIPAWGRWVGCLNFTELFGRKTSTGGYLGICAGFYSF